MAKTFTFPVWLIGTEAEQKAEAERQTLRRASFTRARPTPAEQAVGRGALLEETARGNIKAAKGKNAEARKMAENLLAEALAMQGRFKEAAEVSHDKHHRARFRAIGKAIEMPDEEKCKCKDIDDLTPRFELDRIFSPVHNKMVSLVKCQRCGHLNARPIKNRLLQAQAARRQNRAIATGQGGRGMITDANLIASLS